MPSTNKKTIIYCEKKAKKLYDEIKKSNYFKELDLSIIFCLAAAHGFREGKFLELADTHSGGLIRVEYIENNTELKRILEAIAIAHANSLEILFEKVKIYEIAEAYANGGIRILHPAIFNNSKGPDFDKEIEAEINEIVKKLKK